MSILWIKNNSTTLFFILCSTIIYIYFGYFLARTDFILLCVLWAALFFLSYKIVDQSNKDWKLIAIAALLFRIILLFSTPNLSQDFYRFIWDGRILLNGLNPYLSLPQLWIAENNAPIAQAKELYQGMGTLNGSHFTNYPPISQLCNLITALLSSSSIIGSIIVYRILIIGADFGIFYFGRKLLADCNLPKNRIFWYILNPFVILELTGNLHFESIMIFFIIWSLYLLHKGYWYWAAVVLGLSVSVKLIPLLFLPLFYQKFILKNKDDKPLKIRFITLIGFYSIVLATVYITFAPFLSDQFLANFTKTISLWFQNFEFNASIFYIIRWIGYQTVGWNVIETAGIILPLFTIMILLALTFFKTNKTTTQLITAMLIGISCYYFLSTTVHPWYIAVPLALCVFTNYKFPVIWSFFIVLSYSAYMNADYSENLWLVGLEYVLVFSFFIYEVYHLTYKKHKEKIII